MKRLTWPCSSNIWPSTMQISLSTSMAKAHAVATS
uniref:Uncharacterized protein n=1 Tax=Arundo donax TaxID=35708 RepID=A0A0A9CNL1_ARUDO